MTISTPSLAILGILLALGFNRTPAQAQLSRTFVSAAIGSDGNNCDRPTPCRTFQAAHNKTNADGEITVLDPGGYGSLMITKSISIVNDGVGESSILVSGGATGININAGTAAYVNLRGLTIQGIGFGGGSGLFFAAGFSLTMENCVIRNHTGFGVKFQPNSDSHLSVSNTLVADNGGDGIMVLTNGAAITVKIAFNRVEAYNNSDNGIYLAGIAGTGTLNATALDTVAANNNGFGFRADGTGVTTSLMVARSASSNNGTGLGGNGAHAILRVGQSVITGNATSWNVTGGAALSSYGDNDIDGNGDGDPAIPTIIAKK